MSCTDLHQQELSKGVAYVAVEALTYRPFTLQNFFSNSSTEKMLRLVLLRDGHKLMGVLRSYDQFGTVREFRPFLARLSLMV